MIDAVTYILLFFIYSFIGWLMEVILVFLENHKVVNRGFLIGPYCPIYGCGCLLIIILLKKYMSSYLELFFMSILICSILEYTTSYIMEKLFHARWWDYSDKKFNINGRICLETMIPFGLLGSLMTCIVNPFFVNKLSLIPNIWLNIIATILCIIFIIDLIISFNIINSFKKEIVKVDVDRTEEFSKRVRTILNQRGFLHKRLIKAFPNLKTSREVLLEIQKKINDAIAKIDNKKIVK